MSTVAVVEDDPTMSSLLETFLMLEGFEVVTFQGNSAAELQNFLISTQPGAVVMDVHLRSLNCLELLPVVRQNPELANTYIILSSGMDLCRECLDKGASAFLMKPYMPDDLIALIRQAPTMSTR